MNHKRQLAQMVERELALTGADSVTDFDDALQMGDEAARRRGLTPADIVARRWERRCRIVAPDKGKPREQSWSPVALPLPSAVFTRLLAFARCRAAFSEGSACGLGGARGGATLPSYLVIDLVIGDPFF